MIVPFGKAKPTYTQEQLAKGQTTPPLSTEVKWDSRK